MESFLEHANGYLAPKQRNMSSGRIGQLILPVLAAAWVVWMPGGADAQSTEGALKSKILLRALAYDCNIQSRVGSSVTIAVVYLRSKTESVAAKDDMLAAFKSLGKLTFLSRPMYITEHAFSDSKNLRALIDAGADVLYICPGMDHYLGTLMETARAKKVATITGEADYVRSGLSIGVSLKGRRPQLLVNLPASKAEGLALSAELMRIAEVIR